MAQSITTVQRELAFTELVCILWHIARQFAGQVARYTRAYLKPRQARFMAACKGLTMERYKAWLDDGDGDVVTLTNAQVIKASIATVVAVLLMAIL